MKLDFAFHPRSRLYLAFILCSLLLASCFSSDDPVVDATPVQMRIASFPDGSAWAWAEDAVIAQFRAEHPQLEAQRQGYQQSIEQTLAASPPPDIMLTATIYSLFQAIGRGQVLDVTELWEGSGMLQSYPAAFHGLSQQDGKQFFVPIGYPWSAIYYNRELFQELGLQPPQTWDEFLVVCEQLKDFGITPLSLSSNDPSVAMFWFEYLNLRINGAAFHRQLLRGEISFEDSRVLAVLERWQMLFANGYFVERPADISNLESLMALVRGDQGRVDGRKAAMLLTHSALLAELPPAFQEELDFFRFPILDPSIPVAEALVVYGYMIPKEAEQVEAALTFLAHAASAEAQALLAEHLNSGTVVYAPTNMALEQEELPADMQKGMAIVGDAADIAPFFLFNLPDSMAADVSLALRNWLRQPETVYEFAFALETARQKALAENLLTPTR